MPDGIIKTVDSSIFNVGLDAKALLGRFDSAAILHCQAHEAIQQNIMIQDHEMTNGKIIDGIKKGGKHCIEWYSLVPI